MIGDEIQDKLTGIVMGKAQKQMLLFQISKAINAFLESPSVVEQWTELEENDSFDRLKIFEYIRKDWENTILPIYREKNANKAENLRQKWIRDCMDLVESEQVCVRRQLGVLVDDILAIINAKVQEIYPSANMKEEHQQQQIDAFVSYMDETKALPEKVRVLEKRQDNIEQTVRKNYQDVHKLVYDFSPVVEHVIVRTKLQQSFSQHFEEYNILQILGQSASGKSTFAKQYVPFYNESHEKCAVYVEFIERDSFDALEKLLEENREKIGLVIIDFVHGIIPLGWTDRFFAYMESGRVPDTVQWMMFAQEAVFPEMKQVAYRIYGINNELHMLGVDMQEWKLLVEHYGGSDITPLEMEKIYHILSAGKASGIYIKDARMLASLSKEEMWETIRDQRQNISSNIEKDRFLKIYEKYPESALVSCMLEAFSIEELEEIDENGHWKAVISELYQKGLLIISGHEMYIVHETTRINMEQLITKHELKKWHICLADYCNTKGLMVERVIHMQKSGQKREADMLAKDLFLRGENAWQILGYLKQYPLFKEEELVTLLFEEEKQCYEVFLLLKEKNGPEVAELLFHKIMEKQNDWCEHYHAVELAVKLILDVFPDRWFALIHLGCKENKTEQEGYLLDYICLACRNRKLPIDYRIQTLMMQMYRQQYEKRLLLLCQLVFQQQYLPGYRDAWNYVAEAKEGSEKRHCIDCVNLKEKKSFQEFLLCIDYGTAEKMVKEGRFFDRTTLRFILEHQEVLQPYCTEVMESMTDGEKIIEAESKEQLAKAIQKQDRQERLYKNAILVLLCYHDSTAKDILQEQVKQANREPFWQGVHDCAWNISSWKAIPEGVMDLITDDSICLKMLCSNHKKVQLMAVVALHSRKVDGAKTLLLQLLEEQQDEKVIASLIIAAVENDASLEELYHYFERYDFLKMWWIVLVEKEHYLEAVPELKKIAFDSMQPWKVRRQAIWCLTTLDADALVEVANSILWDQPVSAFDDSIDLEGHQIFVHMIEQGILVLLDNNREENMDFLTRLYCQSVNGLYTKEECRKHVAWFYSSLEEAGGVKRPDAIEVVMNQLCYPQLQAAVLRGLRKNGEQKRLEEVISKTTNRWMVLRAVCEWSKICEEGSTAPSHHFAGWDVLERVLQEGTARRQKRAEGTGRRKKNLEYSPISVINYDEAVDLLTEKGNIGDGIYLNWRGMTREQKEKLHTLIVENQQKEKVKHPGEYTEQKTVMLLDGSDYYMKNQTSRTYTGESAFVKALKRFENHYHVSHGTLNEFEGQKGEYLIQLCLHGEKQKVLNCLQNNRKLWYKELLEHKVGYALLEAVNEEWIPLMADWCVLSWQHLELVCRLMQKINDAAYDHFLIRLLGIVLREALSIVISGEKRQDEYLLGRSFHMILEHPRFEAIPYMKQMVLCYLVMLSDLFLIGDMIELVQYMPEAFTPLQLIRFQTIEFRCYWYDRIDICSDGIAREHT